MVGMVGMVEVVEVVVVEVEVVEEEGGVVVWVWEGLSQGHVSLAGTFLQ